MNNSFSIIAILLFFFLKNIACFSQEDQIKTIDFKETTYQDLVLSYSKAHKISDTIQMYAVANLILDKAKKENKPAYYVKAYHCLSSVDRLTGKYEVSLKHIDKAISYLTKVNDYENSERVYISKAILQQTIGEYKEALETYLNALKVIEDREKSVTIVQILLYNNIAALKSSLDDSEGAIEGFSKVLKFIKDDRHKAYRKFYKVSATLGIAEAYVDIGNYSEGIEYCKELIKISKEFENKEGIIQGYIGFGRIYSLTNEYEKALSYLELAEQVEKNSNKDFLDANIHLFKARSFFFLNKYDEVLNELKKLENLINKNKFKFFHLEEMHVLYAKTYQKLKNIEKAVYYYNKSLEVVKENNQRKIRLGNRLLKKYDLITIEKKRTLAELELKNENEKIKKISVLFIGLLILSVVFFFYTRKKRKRKFNLLMTRLNTNTQRVYAIEIEDQKVKRLLKKIELFEKNKKYLHKNLSLPIVAKQLNTNTAYLSKVVNTHKKKSFSAYIIDLKLEAVIKKLKEESRFRAYKIDAIAEEVGFNSVTTFTRVFKKKTGIYPSYFIKQLKKDS